MRHPLLVTALLLTLCNTLSAQYAQPQPSAAWTTCRGTAVATYINVAILSADSTEEILRHEARHREQADSVVALHGGCFVPISAETHLRIEAEAYCASDSVRVRVKKTPPFEAASITLGRLLKQFYPTISADTIVTVWRRACP